MNQKGHDARMYGLYVAARAQVVGDGKIGQLLEGEAVAEVQVGRQMAHQEAPVFFGLRAEVRFLIFQHHLPAFY